MIAFIVRGFFCRASSPVRPLNVLFQRGLSFTNLTDVTCFSFSVDFDHNCLASSDRNGSGLAHVFTFVVCE